MPELPEVETIRMGLEKKIVGLTVKNVEVRSAKSFIGENGKPFGSAQGLQGRKVVGVWRRAKMLGVELAKVASGSGQGTVSNLLTLLFHLKMTGQIIYQKSNIKNQNDILKLKNNNRFIGGHPTEDMVGPMPNSHTRVIFTFSDPFDKLRASDSKLYFNDQRKFGWIRVVDRGQVTGDSSLKKLGPEPLEKEFTWQILKSNLLNHKSQPVKVVLMDQAVVSGVGNIYSNEACFNARIDPRAKSLELSDEQFKKLYTGLLKALRDGIKYGGATRAHFVDSEGHKGYFLDYAFVYGLDKHPCKVCKTEIKKISLGGRGTYFCPACQR